MWAFEKFPAKLEFLPEGIERPTYQVEVFGYSFVGGGWMSFGTPLIVFRETVFWVGVDIGNIHLLPVGEFEEKFKKYKLLEDTTK